MLPELAFREVVPALLLQKKRSLKDRWWCHPVVIESIELTRSPTKPDEPGRGKFTGWLSRGPAHLDTAPAWNGAATSLLPPHTLS